MKKLKIFSSCFARELAEKERALGRVPALDNRHTFLLSFDGWRLLFIEYPQTYENQPYADRLSVLSQDQDFNSARFGIGKKPHSEASSFADAVEKEMVLLERELQSVEQEIKRLKSKKKAMEAFQSVLPKILLEDGVDRK